MTRPSDTDFRIAALCSEYEAAITALARRGASLAAELASTRMLLKTFEDSVPSPKGESTKPEDINHA